MNGRSEGHREQPQEYDLPPQNTGLLTDFSFPFCSRKQNNAGFLKGLLDKQRVKDERERESVTVLIFLSRYLWTTVSTLSDTPAGLCVF